MHIFVAVIFVVLIGGLGAYFARYSEQKRFKKRLNKVLGVESGKGKELGSKASAFRRRQIQDKLKELEDAKKNQQKRLKPGSVKALLLQGGSSMTPAKFIMTSIILGGGASFLIATIRGFDITSGVIAFVLIFGIPRWLLKRGAKKRMKQFTMQFADAIDVIVRGIQSGLPVGECVNMIGREMPDPVGQEFRLITEGQKLGLPLDEIMSRALERMPTEQLKFFSIVMSIQQETGGNLAETLSKLSNVLRGRKRMKDKVAALSSEAKASAMIIGSLPFALGTILWLIAPDYISVLFDEWLGHIFIGGGLFWMTIGILVMKKMINFDF